MVERPPIRFLVGWFAGVGLALSPAAVSGRAGPAAGRLAASTQISFGCPGPSRVGGPPCEHWSSFANARFTVTRLVREKPSPGTRLVVRSDSRGRFSIALAAGRYLLRPLAQPHTTGGTTLRVRVRIGVTTWTLVRFQGFPRML